MSEVYLGKNYIDGQWGEHRKDFSSLNPATEEPVAWFPQTPAVEVRAAVNAAKVAQKKWRKVSRVLRGELLKKVAQLVEHE